MDRSRSPRRVDLSCVDGEDRWWVVPLKSPGSALLRRGSDAYIHISHGLFSEGANGISPETVNQGCHHRQYGLIGPHNHGGPGLFGSRHQEQVKYDADDVCLEIRKLPASFLFSENGEVADAVVGSSTSNVTYIIFRDIFAKIEARVTSRESDIPFRQQFKLHLDCRGARHYVYVDSNHHVTRDISADSDTYDRNTNCHASASARWLLFFETESDEIRIVSTPSLEKGRRSKDWEEFESATLTKAFQHADCVSLRPIESPVDAECGSESVEADRASVLQQGFCLGILRRGVMTSSNWILKRVPTKSASLIPQKNKSDRNQEANCITEALISKALRNRMQMIQPAVTDQSGRLLCVRSQTLLDMAEFCRTKHPEVFRDITGLMPHEAATPQALVKELPNIQHYIEGVRTRDAACKDDTVESRLAKMVGMVDAKRGLQEMKRRLLFAKLRQRKNLSISTGLSSYHLCLMGNPGTGILVPPCVTAIELLRTQIVSDQKVTF